MINRVKELEQEVARLKMENNRLRLLTKDNQYNVNDNRSTDSILSSSDPFNFKSIFNNNIFTMLLIDPKDGRIIDANESALRFYGYKLTEIKEMKISDINILPHDEVKLEMEKALNDENNTFNFKHRLASGEVKDVLVTSDGITVGENKYLISIIIDVTRKMQENYRVVNSELKFKQMFNSINDMIIAFKINEEGKPSKLFEANDEACRKLGYTYDELLQLSPSQIEKNTHNKIIAKTKEVLKSNNKIYYETVFVTKDLRYIPVEINTLTFALMGEKVILMVARDISKRKGIEKELRNSIKQQQKLLSFLPAAIFIVDKNKILSVNEYGKNLLGYDSSDELLGKDYLQVVVHPDYHDKVNARHKITKLDDPLIEEKYLKKNGEVVDVEVTALKIPYESGSALLIFATNITEWKNIQNELLEKNQVEKLRTEFFANISHELRTPLNVILGSLQLQEFYLKSEKMGRNTTKYKKIHERTKRNCYRLLRLVNNLIDITRIDSGFYNVDLQNYDIVDLIGMIVKSIEDYVARQNLSVEFKSNLDSLVIACDPEKIERVMLNLLSNAIKFTESNGHIKVTIKAKEQYVIISVKDSGIGIPKEKQSAIFDRFVQVDKSLTRRHEGSGIGLSLVKSLVEMHKGSILVKSAVEEGSEFIVQLPLETVANNDIDYKASYYEAFNIERMRIEFSDIYSK